MNLIDLYPLQFSPIYKKKIWGGEKIKTFLKREIPIPNCGESWEISGLRDNISQVAKGPLKGKFLTQLITEHQENLVGGKVFNRFGENFPLLIKFIDAREYLSIQVHPNDELAKRRHNISGKSEMWYILQAEKEASLICGFNQKIDKEKYIEHLKNKTLTSILNIENVKAEDSFFLPPGRIHAIGGGILLLEIQQSSNVTYRIYDWDRVNNKGRGRALHTELALDAIDWSHSTSRRIPYQLLINNTQSLVDCAYFKTSVIYAQEPIHFNYSNRDSFTIYVVVQGEGKLHFSNRHVNFSFGDTFLLPANLPAFKLIPSKTVKIIETYIP